MGLDKFEGNLATEWGTKNEANAIADYQAFTGNLVTPTGLHIHPHHNWLAGSPDGFVGEEGMIEVKCPFYYRKDGGRLHKEVPIHYMCQMNALMAICDRQWCDYVCWEPNAMVVYRVQKDPQLFDFLLTYYGQFYAAMQANLERPPHIGPLEVDNIRDTIYQSMQQTVDYKFWEWLPTHPPPSSDPFDNEDEEVTRSAKRQRVSGVPGDGLLNSDTTTTGDSEMAG